MPKTRTPHFTPKIPKPYEKHPKKDYRNALGGRPSTTFTPDNVVHAKNEIGKDAPTRRVEKTRLAP